MPTLKNLKQINWFFWLIVFASLGILVSAAVRLITPQEPMVIESDFVRQNLNSSATQFEGLIFTPRADLVNPPEKMSLYAAMPTKQTAEAIKQNLIDNFKLKTHSLPADYQTATNLWSGADFFLTYDQDIQRYFFSRQKSPQENTYLSSDLALSTCQTFFNNYFPQSLSLEPVKDQTTYLSGKLEPKPVQPSQAEWIEVPYTLAVDGYPVFHKNSTKYPILCLVNSQKSIQKLEFQPIFFQPKLVDQVSTISPEEALKNINQLDQAAIINVIKDDFGPLQLAEVISGEINQVNLEYRLDPHNQIIYPFYRLFGNVTNQQGQILSVEIITPAVRTQQMD